MSAERSKSILQAFKDRMAWIGSFFLWFITPTGAAALWEKWAKEKEERDAESPSSPKDL